MFDELRSEVNELWNSLRLKLVKVGDKLGYIANPLYKLSFSYEPLNNEFDVNIDLFGYDDMHHWIALLFGETLEKFLQDNCDKSVQLNYIFLSDDTDDTDKHWIFAFSVDNLIELVENSKIPIYKVEKEKGINKEIFKEYLKDKENSDKEDIRNDIVNMIKDTIEDIIDDTDDLQRIKDRYQEDKSKKYQIDTEDIIVKYPKDKENSDKEDIRNDIVNIIKDAIITVFT